MKACEELLNRAFCISDLRESEYTVQIRFLAAVAYQVNFELEYE